MNPISPPNPKRREALFLFEVPLSGNPFTNTVLLNVMVRASRGPKPPGGGGGWIVFFIIAGTIGALTLAYILSH